MLWGGGPVQFPNGVSLFIKTFAQTHTQNSNRW